MNKAGTGGKRVQCEGSQKSAWGSPCFRGGGQFALCRGDDQKASREPSLPWASGVPEAEQTPETAKAARQWTLAEPDDGDLPGLLIYPFETADA